MIFYGILDIFTKPIFAFLTLFLHRNMDIVNKEHYQTEVYIEQPKYYQQQQVEDYSMSYVMPSPNTIRIHH